MPEEKIFVASIRYKIVCHTSCFHVPNIKPENRIYFDSLEEAEKKGCRPCKHCNGKPKKS